MSGNEHERNSSDGDNLDPTKLSKLLHNRNRQESAYYLSDGRRDWGGRMKTKAEMADKDERDKGWGGKQVRAAYYAMVGDAPSLGPDDRDGASAYLKKLSQAINVGRWTKSEWRRLKDLHLKWWKRANGEDPYFEAYGNRRQWADHGRTYKNKEDKATFEASQRIKEIVRNEIVEIKRAREGETMTERVKRLRAIEAEGGRSGNGDNEYNNIN